MSGEPLLLLCGLGCDADSWRDQADALRGRALVTEGDSIEAMAANVLARAPDRFALAGHSMGGYVALAIALSAPERVSRLALLNTSAAADLPEQRENRLRTIAALEARGLAPILALLPVRLSDDPAVQARTADMLRRAGVERVLREQRACLARPDRRAELARLAIPALVIGAGDDIVVPPSGSGELAARIPLATLSLLPEGGHMLPMARPAEVTTLLSGWLAAPDKPGDLK